MTASWFGPTPLRVLALAGCFFFSFSPSLTSALPIDGHVAGGVATIEQAASETIIRQYSDRALLDWRSFSIGQQETVQFLQPGHTSLAVNRILGGDPSIILGNLLANGRVFLLNPNGVVFGSESVLNVGGLLASTLSLQSYDLDKGKFSFAQDPTKALAAVINGGSIVAADRGFMVLTAPGLVNEGLIVAKFGQAGLGAGTQMTVDFRGDGLIQYAVDGKVLDHVTDPNGHRLTSALSNRGRIEADGGMVLFTAQASSAVLSSVINQTGIIQARRLEQHGGEIVLRGGEEGIVTVAGRLDVRGEKGEKSEKSERGGTIQIAGQGVFLLGETRADGTAGGRITVEGDYILHTGTLTADGSAGHGGTVTVTATNRIIQTQSAVISAQGGLAGVGGTVVVQAAAEGGVFSSGTLLSTGLQGGTIELLGGDLVLAAATADASGEAAGGTILIGGDFQGKGDVPHAATTMVNPFSTLKADGRESGNGGKIVVWSDRQTEFYGSASTRGGILSGDGGLIEVSSKDTLHFAGQADVGAPVGSPGMVLLDPKFITISNSGSIPQYTFSDPNPSAGNGFGNAIVPLSTGNVVITSPFADFGVSATDAGAAYLFNGQTGALIATLTGSHNSDKVGEGGVTALTNGHYVVSSYSWDSDTEPNVGAVTWGHGTSGISGSVSPSNSLIGHNSDSVGFGGVFPLTNGNYVVVSTPVDMPGAANAGAATWMNGATGKDKLGSTGFVTSSNSLVGSVAFDQVGSGGVTVLTNGNYVVASPLLDNGIVAADIGAVTWGNGATGVSGIVLTANSLTGRIANDQVGSGGVTALTNGNYVVASPNWDRWDGGGTVNVGAVTWANGATGKIGEVSSANSLVGTIAFDQVGSGGVTRLANGNYVVYSPLWNNDLVADAGAVTWLNGSSFATGSPSPGNSLYGATVNDHIGSGGITTLTNGNYIVSSPLWDNGGIVDAGAVILLGGTAPTAGTHSTSNSLYGTHANDQVGSGGVTALIVPGTAFTGDYVVSSPLWDNLAVDVGAVTKRDGNAVIGSAAVSPSNSLVGQTAGDQVGSGGVTALTGFINEASQGIGGHYVISSPLWDNGSTLNAGAVTLVNLAIPLSGSPTTGNSLHGTHPNDQVGSGGVKALTNNGNYVVNSPLWDDGAVDVGAVTWRSGTTFGSGNDVRFGVGDLVSASNSLVGSSPSDLAVNVVQPLPNGNYVVASQFWDNGGSVNSGAVTWGNGTSGVTGPIAAANSLIGTAGEGLGGAPFIKLDNVNGTYIAKGIGRATAGFQEPSTISFTTLAGQSVTISPIFLSRLLETGDVTLQASTDLTFAPGAVIQPLISNHSLFIQAGRSIIMDTNSKVILNGGDFDTVINEFDAVAAHRDPGMAQFKMNNGAQIVTNGGDVFVIAESFGGNSSEVRIGNGLGGATISSAGGFMQIGPITGFILEPGSILQTTTGDMKIITDTIALNGGVDSVRGNGLLQLEPRNATSIGIGDGAAGTFNLTSAEVLALKDGFSKGITIGASSGQQIIDIQAVTFHDNVFIRGGVITVNGTLASTGSVLLKGSGNTVHLFADIVTDGAPIGIDDNVILEGGAGVTRRLVTTGIVPDTFPSGADVEVSGTIKGSAQSGEAIDTNAGTQGNLKLLDDIGCTPHPCSGFVGAVTGQGQTAEFGGKVYVGPDGQIVMDYPGGMNFFRDMKSPNAALIADGPVTIWEHLTLDVGMGSLEFKSTVKTVVIDPNTGLVVIDAIMYPTIPARPRINDLTVYGNVIKFSGGPGSIQGAGLNGTLVTGSKYPELNGTIHTNSLTVAQGFGASNTSLDVGMDSGTGSLVLSANTLAALGTGNNAFHSVAFGRTDTTALITVGNFTAPFPLTLAAKGEGGTIQVEGALSSQGHSVTLEASKTIALNAGASVTTNNAPLTLEANALGTATGNFVGIDVNGATVSSGSGALSLTGTGGTSGADNYGVQLRGAAQLQTTSGAIQVDGTGGTGGTNRNVGVHLEGGSLVSSSSGLITITGHGGNGGGLFNRGVDLLGPGTIVSSTTGAIDIQGTGGANASFSYGVAMAQGQVRSGGDISLAGQGGAGSPGNVATLGMLITNGSQVEGLGNASVTLTGTGGAGTATSATNGEVGVFMHGQNGTFIRTANGDLTINGTGHGTGIGGQGVIQRAGALVESTGTGNVSVTGIGSLTGSANNNGIQMIEAGTTVRANAGNLAILGTAHGALNSNNNIGLAIASGALVQKTGTGGTVSITGTGGDGGGGTNNFGVALLSAPTQILANGGAITITGMGTNGTAGVTAQGGFVVSPGIPCGPCTPSANLDAGAGGTITITSTP